VECRDLGGSHKNLLEERCLLNFKISRDPNPSVDTPYEKARKQRAKNQRRFRKIGTLKEAVEDANGLEDKKEAARRLEAFNGGGYFHLEYTLGEIILKPLLGRVGHFLSRRGIMSPRGIFVLPKPNDKVLYAARKIACFDLQRTDIKSMLFKSSGDRILLERFPDILTKGSKQPNIKHIDELELSERLERVEALFSIVCPSPNTSYDARVNFARRYRDLGGDPGWVAYLEEDAKEVEEEWAKAEKERIKIETLKNLDEEETSQEGDFKINVLPFEVLPPGFLDSSEYYRAFGSSRAGSQERLKKEREERLKFVESLGNHTQYMGSNEIGSKYIVFVFESNVVAECPMEGNAIYVIDGLNDWKKLLRNSKTNLLSDYPDRVRRIIHKTDWQIRLKRALNLPSI
jgi:hypothetical protein